MVDDADERTGVLLVAIVLVFVLVASLTGGIAGAIVAGGREDRSILKNAAIGFGGWAGAWIAIRFCTGDWPTELTLGASVLALLFSVAIVRSIERRETIEREPVAPAI